MNNVLMSEMQAAIEKDIPNQVGEALKERLQKAENDKEDLSLHQKANATLREEVKQLKNNITQLNNRINKDGELHRNLKLREEEVGKREQDQAVFEAQLKSIESEKRAEQAIGLATSIFKSPVFRSTFSKSTVRDGAYDANGHYQVGVGPVTHETIDRTETQE